MKNLVLQVVLLVGFCLIGFSQSSIDASGGHAKSLSFSFSYSVGEVVSSTLKSTSGNYFATSGVIQPDPILIVNVQDAFLDDQILYPNPVNNVILFYPGISIDIYYTIYKYDGILASFGKLVSNSINVREFTPGLYYIKLTDTKSNIQKIFQFVKS